MKVYKVKAVQSGNKLFIADGHNPLRYIDLETNKVHIYPGKMKFQWKIRLRLKK